MNRHWIAVTAILLTAHTTGFCQQIDWQTDLDSAKTMAARHNKMVLMHFSADWCRPCKHLETFVFTSAKVINAIDERVVAVRVDTDLHPELVKQYNVSEIPTDVVITPAGRIVQKRQSPKDTSNYVHMLTSLDSVGKALSEDKAALAQKIDHILDVGKTKELQSPESNDFVAKPKASQHPGPAHEATQLKENMSSHAKLVDHETSAMQSDFQVESGDADTTIKAREPERVINDRFFSEKSNAADESPTADRSKNADANSPDNAKSNATRQPMSTGLQAVDDNDSEVPSTANMFHSTGESKPVQSKNETTARILTTGMEGTADNASTEKQGSENDSVAKCQNEKCADTTSENPSGAQPENAIESAVPDTNHFGLDGKCPVTLINDGKWADGDSRFGCVHRGKTYLFADQARLVQFQRDPESFSPLLAGFDPVVFHEKGELVEGLEKHGVFMGKEPNQRIVLFQSMQTRTQFQQNPRQYMATIRLAIEETDSLR